MKNIKRIMFTLVVCGGFFMSSCTSSQPAEANETSETQEQGKELTSKYVCPMHCEGSGSEEPGTCPVCEMDYVLNKNHESYVEEVHQHDAGEEHHDHDDHDHNHDDHDHNHEH